MAVRHEAEANEPVGVPSSALATSTDALVALAERAVREIAVAERLRKQVGERPRLDVAAEGAALAAWDLLQQDRRAATAVREDRLRVITTANGAGVGWLAAAVGLSLVARQPLGLAIDFAVALAGAAPIAGLVTNSTRARRARTAVAQRRVACAEALERAGVETMGELRARRVMVDAWSRRRDAARMAAKQADDALVAWHDVAGPSYVPEEVDVLVDRCLQMRREALARMRELLAAHRDRRAAAAEAAVLQVIVPFPEQQKALPAPSRIGAGLERLYGLKLRLWRSA